MESQSEYLHHYGRVHTPLPEPATISKKGVEQLTGELDDWKMMETEQRVGSNSDVEPEVSKSTLRY